MSTITALESIAAAPIQRRQTLTGTEPDVFTNIYRDDTHMAVWQRTLSKELQHAAKHCLSHAPHLESMMVVTPQNARAHLNESLGAADTCGRLHDDISHLVDMFCVLFDLNEVGLRITVLDRAMCPRFHVDQVPCRLVTTYHGTATEWLPHNAVDRSKLGASKPDAQSAFFHQQDIQQLNTGDVALLKGEAWEGNEHAGLVHRSPSLSPNEVRLLCTLDFID